VPEIRLRAATAAALAVAACATTAGPPVHQVGTERRLDLGGLELTLDPTTDQRFIEIEDRPDDHTITFHEKDAEGTWARIEIHRRPIDAATAAALRSNPGLLRQQHYLPDQPLQPATTALGTPAHLVEMGLPEGTHHEPNPDGKGHSTVEDLPRYQWMAALVTPTAVFVLLYTADLHGPDTADLTTDQILVEGRSRHGARAASLLARLRR